MTWLGAGVKSVYYVDPNVNYSLMLHNDITSKILEAAFEVSNELGAGFLESVYEKALVVALSQKGIPVRTQVRLNVKFRDVIVGEFLCRYADC